MPERFGIIPWTPDEYPLALERARFVGDAVAAVAATDERIAARGGRADRRRVRDPPRRDRPRRRDRRSPRSASARSGKDNVSQGGRARVRRRRRRCSPRSDVVVEGDYYYEGSAHVPIETALRDRPARHERPAHRVVGDAGPALPAPRALARAAPLARAHPRHPAARRRRLRRQERAVLARVLRGQARDDHRAARSSSSTRARRSSTPTAAATRCACTMKVGATRDGKLTGGRRAHATSTAARTRRSASSPRTTRASSSRCPRSPRLPLPVDALLHQQAALRAQARPRQRAAALRLRGLARQDRRARSAMDPIELRRQNLGRAERRARSTGCASRRTASLECLDRVEEASRLEGAARQARPTAAASASPASAYISGTNYCIYPNEMPQSARAAQGRPLGRRHGVLAAQSEIGQGCDTMLAVLVADELGLDLGAVRVVSGDTDLCPVDLGAYSSRGTFMNGNAALHAAQQVREKLVEAVAEKLGVTPREVLVTRGALCVAADPAQRRARRPRPSSSPSRSSARSARSATTTRPSSAATTAAAPSAPRPRTRSPRTSPRSRSTPRPAASR